MVLWGRLGGGWIDPNPAGTEYATNLVAFGECLLDSLPYHKCDLSTLPDGIEEFLAVEHPELNNDQFAVLLLADYICMLQYFKLAPSLPASSKREAASSDMAVTIEAGMFVNA